MYACLSAVRPPTSGVFAVASAVVVVAVLTGGCSGDADGGTATRTCADAMPVAADHLRIVTTVAPITNIVSVIAAGTGARVEGIVPEGADSHTYEPTARVAASLERADVVFLNGLELEAPTKRLALANAPTAVVCELGDEVLDERDYIFDFSYPESAGSPNPHLWTSPPFARSYAGVVRDVLAAADPEHVDIYRANYAEFASRVDELDRAVRAAGGTIPRGDRLLLTYHDAYAYFAREYDWTVVGAVQPSSFDEPTPREVAALIQQVRDRRVGAIFGSEVFPSPVLRQLAAEAGVDYVDDLRDDDLPGEPGDVGHSWLGLMQFNIVTIVEALGGDVGAVTAIDVSSSTPDEATYAQE